MDHYRKDDLGGLGQAEDRAAPAPAATAQASEPAGSLSKGSRKAAVSADVASRERPGLGTEFGEAVASNIQEVEFLRANASVPSVILGVRYNDRDGLLAMGVNVDGVYPWPDTELRRTADPFPSSPRRYAAPPKGWQR
jgi:hypothetical protein